MSNLVETALAEGTFVFYTDGSCAPNPGRGGHAAIQIHPNDEEPTEHVGWSLDTTNNIQELMAVKVALENTPVGSSVLIFADANYVIKGITDWREGWERKGWKNSKGKLIPNLALWREIFSLVDERSVSFKKVAAHSGDPFNERADTLASEAAENANTEYMRLLREEFSVEA